MPPCLGQDFHLLRDISEMAQGLVEEMTIADYLIYDVILTFNGTYSRHEQLHI